MRIDFYKPVRRFLDDPTALLTALAIKCFEQGQQALWLVPSMEAAEALDARLWETPEDAFLPHQICGDEDDRDCPLLIVPPGARCKLRPVIFNQRTESVKVATERLIELIPADAEGTAAARRRWADYAARGEKPSLIEV